MGNNARIYISFTLVLLLFACQNDEMLREDIGFLSIGDVEMAAVAESMLKTRSVDNDLSIEIQNAQGGNVVQYTAGTAIPEKIVLTPGNYTLKAYTPNANTWKTDNEGRGSVLSYGEIDFTIESDWVTYVNYEVPIYNYGVQLILPQEFEDYFPEYHFVVSSGGRSPEIDETQTAYFAPEDGGFSFTLTMTNYDGETFTTNRYTYKNVTAGKIYKVKFDYSDEPYEPNLSVVITYEDFTNENNQQIIIDGATGTAE